MNERIKELRKTLNMSMDRFGERIGIKKSAISLLENGKNSASEQTIRAICREFNVHENWLRNGCGPMFEPNPQTELAAFCKKYELNEMESSFVETYINLDSDSRKAVFNFISEWFTKMNETDVALEEPANIQPIAYVPAEIFQGAPDIEGMSIDEKCELYRRSLELEEKVAAKSSVS